MASRFLIFIALIGIQTVGYGQISGVVKDKANGKVLQGVEVFINNSSWKTSTNEGGAFELNEIYPGFVDLVLYKKGYSIFKSSIRIQDGKQYKLNLTLTSEDKPKPPKIKKDGQWNDNFKWFQQGLIGSSTSAECKIENTSSLFFERANNVLIAKSDEPLRVENLSLGFVMNVYLLEFEATSRNSKFQALINYEITPSDDYNQQQEWERQRLKAYWGSSRHFFQSLIAGITVQEGFSLHDKSGVRVDAATIVSEGSFPGYYKVNMTDSLQIIYKMESSRVGKVDDSSGQVSWLIPAEPMQVSELGVLFNPKSVVFKGAMSDPGLAEYLPINYIPTASISDEQMDWKNFAMLREKVYLHTDRDYYYPRESIWFKAYMGYSLPMLRDTLSRTLYVELISPERKAVDTKVYRIEKGVSSGDIKLPDSLPSGQYYLRAYTNWMRNYGDSAFFVKPVPVLSWNQNIEPVLKESTESSHISIGLNQTSFGARQKVDVSVHVMNDQGSPAKGNLSVSVTDVVSAVPLQTQTITAPRSLRIYDIGEKNKYFDNISYYMERGISFHGKVLDSKGEATACQLEIVQGNMDNLISMETDEHGEFTVTGLNFMDSLVFAFKPMNKKGKLLNRVDLFPREVPPFKVDVTPLVLKYRNEDALQRIQNSYRADDNVVMLNEVEVKSSSLADNAPGQTLRIYGNPDYVIKGENIVPTASSNFLVGLQGKVPGLQVIESDNGFGIRTVSVKIRGGTSSMAGDTSPLFLVDGVPFPDAQSISAINPAMVDRVEVVTRASPQFGSRGSNGVIAIYTKSGFSKESIKNYLSQKIKGYDRTRTFSAPDYSKEKDAENADFRTTVFWSPELITDDKGNASFSFYTADLATRYRIVVEGITEDGRPVRAVSYITVE